MSVYMAGNVRKFTPCCHKRNNNMIVTNGIPLSIDPLNHTTEMMVTAIANTALHANRNEFLC